MKSFTAHIKRVGLAAVALSLLGITQNALAGGTDAGISISNTATINYSVNSLSQPAITSAPVAFVVDHKVDLTVSAGSNKLTQPNATNVALPYTVTNTGNKADTFTLSIQSITGGFVPTGAFIWVDANNNNVVDVGESGTGTGTSATNTITLNKDASATVRIVAASIPGTATNAQVANLVLRATTTSVKTVGADTAGEDVVFADSGNDGFEQTTNAYVIDSAALSLNKAVSLVKDPINNISNPKAIPGATMHYTITVTNAATATQSATGIVVTDTIPATTAYVAGTIAKTGGTAAAPTNANVVGNALSVTVGDLAPGGSATVSFDVTIN